jgi:hypothetical protein
MAKAKSIEEKRATYCLDCSKDSETCGKDPLECQGKKEAELYFDLYNETASKYRNM